MISRERAKGRREKGNFAQIPVAVLKSPACATLNHAAFRVLVALAAQYRGSNNGALALDRESAKEFGITSHDTLDRSLRQLEEQGLILRTHPGSFIPRAPARFALGWRPMDATAYSKETKTPPGTWKDWTKSR